MGPPHLGTPIFKGTFASVVSILHRPEYLLRGLDNGTVFIVVAYFPDELLGLLVSVDHEAIDRGRDGLSTSSLTRHDRIMAVALALRQADQGAKIRDG